MLQLRSTKIRFLVFFLYTFLFGYLFFINSFFWLIDMINKQIFFFNRILVYMESWISLSIYNVLIDNNVLLFLTVCVIWNWLYWFIRDVELRHKTRRSCILHNTLEITCIWNNRQWKHFALHCFFFYVNTKIARSSVK